MSQICKLLTFICILSQVHAERIKNPKTRKIKINDGHGKYT